MGVRFSFIGLANHVPTVTWIYAALLLSPEQWFTYTCVRMNKCNTAHRQGPQCVGQGTRSLSHRDNWARRAMLGVLLQGNGATCARCRALGGHCFLHFTATVALSEAPNSWSNAPSPRPWQSCARSRETRDEGASTSGGWAVTAETQRSLMSL